MTKCGWGRNVFHILLSIAYLLQSSLQMLKCMRINYVINYCRQIVNSAHRCRPVLLIEMSNGPIPTKLDYLWFLN